MSHRTKHRKAFPPVGATGVDVVRESEGWGVRVAGGRDPVSVHRRQSDALAAAAEMVSARGEPSRRPAATSRGRGARKEAAVASRRRGGARQVSSDALTVGAFDAKTNLSGLLDRVEGGGVVVITRHDRPVARLVPYATDGRDPVLDAIARLKAADFGARLPRGKSLTAFLREARR